MRNPFRLQVLPHRYAGTILNHGSQEGQPPGKAGCSALERQTRHCGLPSRTRRQSMRPRPIRASKCTCLLLSSSFVGWVLAPTRRSRLFCVRASTHPTNRPSTPVFRQSLNPTLCVAKKSYKKRRARDSNPQPVSRHLISNQAASHSRTLRPVHVNLLLRARFGKKGLDDLPPKKGVRCRGVDVDQSSGQADDRRGYRLASHPRHRNICGNAAFVGMQPSWGFQPPSIFTSYCPYCCKPYGTHHRKNPARWTSSTRKTDPSPPQKRACGNVGSELGLDAQYADFCGCYRCVGCNKMLRRRGVFVPIRPLVSKDTTCQLWGGQGILK